MSASYGLPLICFFTVLSSTISQLYYPYNQYVYQYYPSQSAVYTPYPYQQYISNPTPSYANFAPLSYSFNGYVYPVQQGYSYPYNYPQYASPQTYPSTSAVTYNYNQPPKNQSESEDPYANIKVEIVDVEPKNFHYYKRFFGLEDNNSPVQVIEDDTVRNGGQRQPQIQPQVTVKTESNSYNYSNVPKGVSIHDVKTKSYSFKRTFTLDPTKKENAVINLNFVNGVQVTTTEAPKADSNREEEDDEETDGRVATEEPVLTTTESEEAKGVISWFK